MQVYFPAYKSDFVNNKFFSDNLGKPGKQNNQCKILAV